MPASIRKRLAAHEADLALLVAVGDLDPDDDVRRRRGLQLEDRHRRPRSVPAPALPRSRSRVENLPRSRRLGPRDGRRRQARLLVPAAASGEEDEREREEGEASHPAILANRGRAPEGPPRSRRPSGGRRDAREPRQERGQGGGQRRPEGAARAYRRLRRMGAVAGSGRRRGRAGSSVLRREPTPPRRNPDRTGKNDRGLSRKHVMESINGSLRRLQTDYVDVYQAHRYDYETPLAETMGAFADIVRAGKTHYIGVSEWTVAEIRAGAALADELGIQLVASQPQYNMLWRVIEAEVVPACEELGITQVCWSPLAQGVLSGKYGSSTVPAGSRFSADDGGLKIEHKFMQPTVMERVEKLKPIAADLECRWPPWPWPGCWPTPTSPRRLSAPAGRSSSTIPSKPPIWFSARKRST